MFRFTLRDVFWLTLVAALVLTWWREGVNLDAEKRSLENEIRIARGMGEDEKKALQTERNALQSEMKAQRAIDSYYVAEGWQTAADPDEYELGLDSDCRRAGKYSAFIKPISPSPARYGVLYQTIRADQYRGQRLRFTSHIKIEAPTPPRRRNSAAIFIGLKPGLEAPYADYWKQLLNGPTDWQQYDLVVDVPPDAALIVFGVDAISAIWIDDLQLEIVGSEIPVSLPYGNVQARFTLPKTPKNFPIPSKPHSLDFEPRTSPTD